MGRCATPRKFSPHSMPGSAGSSLPVPSTKISQRGHLLSTWSPKRSTARTQLDQRKAYGSFSKL
eukprot:2183132-Prymnesium_polylepis.2